MPLIKCPECGKEVSDKAVACPVCAYPIAQTKLNKVVRIKMPKFDPGFIYKKICTVVDNKTDNIVWEGRLGIVAEFELDGKTELTFYILGKNQQGVIEPIVATIDPNEHARFEIKQDVLGFHWKAKFHLNKVDVIDSD